MSVQIYYLIAGVIIVLTVAAHAYLFRRTISFNHKAAQTSGTVVSGAWSSDGDGGSVCFPVVAFTAASGQQYQFSSSVGTNFPPQTGSTVKVQYDPADPQKAEIGSFTGVWLTPLFFSVFGAVGVIMLVVGALVYPHTDSIFDMGGSIASFIMLMMGGTFSLVAAGLCYFNARSLLWWCALACAIMPSASEQHVFSHERWSLHERIANRQARQPPCGGRGSQTLVPLHG